jgi:hypothetical protein
VIFWFSVILKVSPETATQRCGNSMPEALEAAQRERDFAYESVMIQKSTNSLNEEDPCCLLLDAEQPAEVIIADGENLPKLKLTSDPFDLNSNL